MITPESQRLRDAVRGPISCRCVRPSAVMERLDYHLPNCQWNAAVKRIYEIERGAPAGSVRE